MSGKESHCSMGSGCNKSEVKYNPGLPNIHLAIALSDRCRTPLRRTRFDPEQRKAAELPRRLLVLYVLAIRMTPLRRHHFSEMPDP